MKLHLEYSGRLGAALAGVEAISIGMKLERPWLAIHLLLNPFNYSLVSRFD